MSSPNTGQAAAPEQFVLETLCRLGELETALLTLSRQITCKQNRDDMGVALRYLIRLLLQYTQELDVLQAQLEQLEATLNLLEARTQ